MPPYIQGLQKISLFAPRPGWNRSMRIITRKVVDDHDECNSYSQNKPYDQCLRKSEQHYRGDSIFVGKEPIFEYTNLTTTLLKIESGTEAYQTEFGVVEHQIAKCL